MTKVARLLSTRQMLASLTTRFRAILFQMILKILIQRKDSCWRLRLLQANFAPLRTNVISPHLTLTALAGMLTMGTLIVTISLLTMSARERRGCQSSQTSAVLFRKRQRVRSYIRTNTGRP